MSQSTDASKRGLSIPNEDHENYFANTIIPQLFVDGDLILRIFTPPAMKHFSLTHEDIGKNINDVKDNIKYPTIIENIEEVMVTGEILEKEVQTTDGRWYQMNIIPYYTRKKDNTNGVIITFVDITARIALLNTLEKLNHLNRTLIYTLTHDLRQPISAIVLFTDVLKELYKEQDTQEFNRVVDLLNNTSNNMISLINDYAEIDNYELITADERINFEDVYQDVISALKNEIYKNNVSITTKFKTSEIIFSRNNLRSILFNLINNSIKFKKSDEPLGITISTHNKVDYVILCVEDNGMGIADENLQKIFKKSTRLNNYIEGTGMGLYIIKEMIENKGGRLEVESTLGKGTTFNAYFKSGYEGEVINEEEGLELKEESSE